MYSTFARNLLLFCRVSLSICFVNMSRNIDDTIHKRCFGLRIWLVPFGASYLNFSSSSSSSPPQLRTLLRCVPFRRWQYVCHICLASTYSKHVVCLVRHWFLAFLFLRISFVLPSVFSLSLSLSLSLFPSIICFFFSYYSALHLLFDSFVQPIYSQMRKWWVECFPSLLFVIFVWRNLTAQCQLSLSALFSVNFIVVVVVSYMLFCQSNLLAFSHLAIAEIQDGVFSSGVCFYAGWWNLRFYGASG